MEKEKEYRDGILDAIKKQVDETITAYKESLQLELNQEMQKHITHAENQIELAGERYLNDYKIAIDTLEREKRADAKFMASVYERQRKSIRRMFEHRLKSATNIWLKQIELCLVNIK